MPFIDSLKTRASWLDVLSLLSVDRREAASRSHFINEASAVVDLYARDALDAFVGRYPRCVRRRTSKAFDVAVSFLARDTDREVAASADAAWRDEVVAETLERDIGGVVVTDAWGNDMTIRDAFEHVVSSFLVELPALLQLGQGMAFRDHLSPEGVSVSLLDDGTVEFCDGNGDRIQGSKRAVLVALEDALLRLNVLRQR